MEPRREVRRVADHGLLALDARGAGDHQPGRDTDAGLQRRAIGAFQAADGGDDFQPGPDRAFGRVFLRRWKAEIRQDAIAQILRDMAVVPADDRGASLAVLVQQAAHVLGVELTGERGRADQIAEHHGDLAALDARCLRAWGIPCAGPSVVPAPPARSFAAAAINLRR